MPARSLAALVLLFVGVRVEAQSLATDSRASRPQGWLVGASLGVPGYGSETAPDLFTVGINVTELRIGRPGPDLSIGTMPLLLAGGALPFGIRADFALPIAVAPHLIVLPSAGLSVIGVVASYGGGGIPGANAGIATVLHQGSLGLRTGLTLHSFQESHGAIWLFEVGLVHVPVRGP